jgi:2Fe-2S ferredoxin
VAIVTYIEHNGTEHRLDIASGETIMQGAVDHALDAIVAECGGGLACATCQCYIDDAWIDRVGPALGAEKDMLEFSANDARPGSRLSCQVTVNDDLDGLVVHLPESQY